MLSLACHSCSNTCFDRRMDPFLLQASSLTSRYCGTLVLGRSFACACWLCSHRFQWIAVKTISYSFPCQMSLDCRTLQRGCRPLSLCLTRTVVTVSLPPRTHILTTRTYATSLLTTTAILTLIQILTMMKRCLSLTSPSYLMPSSIVALTFLVWLVSSPISNLSRGNLHTSWRLRKTDAYSVARRRESWSWSSKWKIGTRTQSLTFVCHVWACLLPVHTSILSWKERTVRVELRTKRVVVWKE